MLAGYPVRRSVVVNTKTGRSFRGVLWARKGRFLVLRNATVHDPSAGAVPVDGEVAVHMDNVDFVQVLAGAVE